MTQVNYAEMARLINLGRRAEKRGTAAQGCLTAIALMMVNIFLGGWMFMLAVGVIHAEWLPSVPTLRSTS